MTEHRKLLILLGTAILAVFIGFLKILDIDGVHDFLCQIRGPYVNIFNIFRFWAVTLSALVNLWWLCFFSGQGIRAVWWPVLYLHLFLILPLAFLPDLWVFGITEPPIPYVTLPLKTVWPRLGILVIEVGLITWLLRSQSMSGLLENRPTLIRLGMILQLVASMAFIYSTMLTLVPFCKFS